MSDRPKSQVQLTEQFLERVEGAKQAELARTNVYLMAEPLDVSSLTVNYKVNPNTLEEEYEPFYEELRESVGQVLGTGEDETLGAVADMQAITRQGDFMDTQRRATALRNNSRSRRLVHSAMRRRSHGVDGGYYDRRLVRTSTDLLQSAKDYT
jgi:hypothetical protein